MKQLTDLSGIGEKTAEKLRKEGIETPEQLGEAYEANRRVVRKQGKRVQSAARDYLIGERGGFTDPYTGASIDASNRRAFELLGTRKVSDFDSVSVDGANPSVSPDDEVRKFVEPVREGTFSTDVGGDDNLMQFAADTAQNLGLDDLTSGELQDVNRANETVSREVTLREQSSSGSTTTARGDISVGDYIKASSAHGDRSPEARSVDDRRKAERTQDYEKWQSAPDRYDFPGVDTPGGAGRFFPAEQSYSKRGFGTGRKRNRDRDQVAGAIETVNELNSEQQQRVFGETLGSVSNPFDDER